MSTAESSTALERGIVRVQAAAREVLFLCAKELSSSRTSVLINETISALQLWAVPLSVMTTTSARVPSPTEQSGISALLSGLAVINPDEVRSVFGSTTFVILYSVVLAWTLTFVSMFMAVAISVASDSPRHSPPLLRALRASAKLSTTSLFLPAASLMIRSLGCNGNVWWGSDDVECYGTVHSIIATASIVVLVPFVIISLAVSSVYIDRNPTSKSLDARSHGRCDVFLLILKISLTMLTAFGGENAPLWLLNGFILATGVIWGYLYFHYVPFVSQTTNAVYVGQALGFLWTGTCSTVVWLSDGSQDVGIICILAVPGMVYLGYAGTLLHFRTICSEGDPYRFREQSMWPLVLWTRAKLRIYARLVARTAGFDADAAAAAAESDARGANGAPDPLVTDPRTALNIAIHGIEALEELHSQNGLAHAIAASLYSSCMESSRFKERRAISTAHTLSSTFDISFQFYQSIMTMNQTSSKSRKGYLRKTLSIVDRVIFDQHKRSAAEAQVKAFAVHVALMRHVASRDMDVGFIHERAIELDDALRETEVSIDSMLRINPDSAEALNMAAQFHLELTDNTQASMEFAAKAARLEESTLRERERKVDHVAFSAICEDVSAADESLNAMLTISLDRTRLGEVVATNPVASRTMGITTLLGLNINVLVPSPIREIHDMLLLRFMRRGTSHLIGSTRFLLARHITNGLMPIRFRLYETPPTANDLQPKLTGTVLPVATDEGYVIVGDETTDYSVIGACSRSAITVGIPVDKLNLDSAVPGGVPASALFPGLFSDQSDDAAFASPRSAGTGMLRRNASFASTAKRGQGQDAATVRTQAQGADWLDDLPALLRRSLRRPIRTVLTTPRFANMRANASGGSDGGDGDSDAGSSIDSMDLMGSVDSDGPGGVGAGGGGVGMLDGGGDGDAGSTEQGPAWVQTGVESTLNVVVRTYEINQSDVSASAPNGIILHPAASSAAAAVIRRSLIPKAHAAREKRRASARIMDDDDRKSQASKSSTASKTTLRRTIRTLSQQSSVGTTMMRHALIMTSILFLCLSIGFMIVNPKWAYGFEVRSSALITAGCLVDDLHTAERTAIILSTRDSVEWDTRLTSLNNTRADLTDVITRIDTHRQELFSFIDTVNEPSRDDLLNPLAVPMWVSDPVDPSVPTASASLAPHGRALQSLSIPIVPPPSAAYTEAMSLFDAFSSVVAALDAMDTSEDSITPSDPDTAFILHNAVPSVAMATNASVEVMFSELMMWADFTELLTILIFAATLGLALVVQAILVAWAVRRMFSEQVELLQLFYFIPAKLASGLAAHAETRWRKYQRTVRSIVGGGTGSRQDGGVGGGVGLDGDNGDSDDSDARQREEAEDMRWMATLQAQSTKAHTEYYGDINPLEDMMSPSSQTSRMLLTSTDNKARRERAKERALADIRIHDSQNMQGNFSVGALFPLAMIGLWFSWVFLVRLDLTRSSLFELERVISADQLRITTNLHSTHLLQAALMVPEADSWNVTDDAIATMVEEHHTIVSRLQHTLKGGAVRLVAQTPMTLMPPGATFGPLSADKFGSVYNAFVESACDGILAAVEGTHHASSGIVTAAQCQVVHDAVLARGLSAAIARFVTRSEEALDALGRVQTNQALANEYDALSAANNGTIPSSSALASVNRTAVGEALAAAKAQARSAATEAQQLYDPWLRYAVEWVVATLSASMTVVNAEATAGVQNITIGFLVLFLAVVLFVFLPRHRRIARMVAASRRLLTAIPDEVVSALPALRETIELLDAQIISGQTRSPPSSAKHKKSRGAMSPSDTPGGDSVLPHDADPEFDRLIESGQNVGGLDSGAGVFSGDNGSYGGALADTKAVAGERYTVRTGIGSTTEVTASSAGTSRRFAAPGGGSGSGSSSVSSRHESEGRRGTMPQSTLAAASTGESDHGADPSPTHALHIDQTDLHADNDEDDEGDDTVQPMAHVPFASAQAGQAQDGSESEATTRRESHPDLTAMSPPVSGRTSPRSPPPELP